MRSQAERDAQTVQIARMLLGVVAVLMTVPLIWAVVTVLGGGGSLLAGAAVVLVVSAVRRRRA